MGSKKKFCFLKPLKYLFHHSGNISFWKIQTLEGKTKSSQQLIPFRKIQSCKLSLERGGKLITFNNLRPLMMLWKSVYHGEIQKIHWEFQHLFKTGHTWPWTVPLWANRLVPVASGVGQLVLYSGHTRAIMSNYGGLLQVMHEKSSLKIICTYKWSSFSGHVSEAFGKNKEQVKQLVSN